MIVDTDVLIWYMRGNTRAQGAIDALDAFSISAVTYEVHVESRAAHG